jgi:hypothetical protein
MLCLSETLSQQGTATSVPLRDPGGLLETVGAIGIFYRRSEILTRSRNREALSFVLPVNAPDHD